MIVVNRLTKRFGKVTAVEEVTFSVAAGEVIALWGSNGAGKTTVIRCLLGVLPFSGEVRINGYAVPQEGREARRIVGFVPQEIRFHEHLSVNETLEFFARLKKTSVDTVSVWLDRLQLRPHGQKLVKELSGGMKQKLALAIALLGDPPVLFLDEPTANLDMQSRDDFLDLLNELKHVGKTMVFSSHRLEEVLSFADRVLILDQGRLIADAPPQEVYERLGKRSLLRIYVPVGQVSPALEILRQHGFQASQNGRGIKVEVDAHAKGEPITVLAGAGVVIENFDYEVEG